MDKLTSRKLRQKRVRARLKGTSERPRLSVSISNRHVSAQIVDDSKQVTLAASTSVGQKQLPVNLMERASWVGTDIAKKAKQAKITKLVLDRGGKKYHGRLARLADEVRKNGVEL
ncbi:MAG TPA: 50S ribosomal protein L18 [Candidatus Saccharimonadales bacterium]